MNIQFDLEKEHTLEELVNTRNVLRHFMTSLCKKIDEKELEGIKYEGKFVYIPYYGYMFIKWQTYDGDRIILQGIAFSGSFSPYTDDNWLNYDALEEWRIPEDTFRQYVKNNEIKIITKEEFKAKAKECMDKVYNEFDKMMDKVVSNYGK